MSSSYAQNEDGMAQNWIFYTVQFVAHVLSTEDKATGSKHSVSYWTSISLSIHFLKQAFKTFMVAGVVGHYRFIEF